MWDPRGRVASTVIFRLIDCATGDATGIFRIFGISYKSGIIGQFRIFGKSYRSRRSGRKIGKSRRSRGSHIIYDVPGTISNQ